MCFAVLLPLYIKGRLAGNGDLRSIAPTQIHFDPIVIKVIEILFLLLRMPVDAFIHYGQPPVLVIDRKQRDAFAVIQKCSNAAENLGDAVRVRQFVRMSSFGALLRAKILDLGLRIGKFDGVSLPS